MADAPWILFDVAGMTCGGCERAVTRALGRTPGVLEPGADAKAGKAWARLEPARAEEVRAAVAKAGFSVGSWQVSAARPGR